MGISYKNIDDYIAMQPENDRVPLEALRQIVKEAAPGAEEVISYNMPAFRYYGMLVGFAAAKNHYGFYPWNGHTVAQFKEDLAHYGQTKGAIHFPKNQPLPEHLIKEIVAVRMSENEAKAAEKNK